MGHKSADSAALGWTSYKSNLIMQSIVRSLRTNSTVISLGKEKSRFRYINKILKFAVKDKKCKFGLSIPELKELRVIALGRVLRAKRITEVDYAARSGGICEKLDEIDKGRRGREKGVEYLKGERKKR